MGMNQVCSFDGSNMKSDVKVDGYERLPKNNYDAVMFALVNKGPLALTVFANNHWMDYKEGVYDGFLYD